MNSSYMTIHGKQSFLAGVLMTSAIWALVSLYSNSVTNKRYRRKRRHDSQNGNTSLMKEETNDDFDDGYDTNVSMQCEDKMNPLDQMSYNPWRKQEVVQYKQLLELRKSFLEHSKRTSLLFLDTIISQAKLLELPSRKRLRWPWETMRKHQDSSGGEENNMMCDSGHFSNDSNYASTSSGHDSDYMKEYQKGNSSSFSHIHTAQPQQASLGSDDNSSTPEGSMHERQNEREICIGSIFGLDVGGTLSKLVYFEKKKNFMRKNKLRRHSSSPMKQQLWCYPLVDAENEDYDRDNTEFVGSLNKADGNIYVGDSHSYPTDSGSFTANHDTSSQNIFHAKDVRNGCHSPSEQSSGTLKRSRSLYALNSKQARTEMALNQFYDFARKLDSDHMELKDKSLSFYSNSLGGEFHFIQFETRYLPEAIHLIKLNDLHKNISKMGATGGGAHKYHNIWKDELGIEMVKQGELDSLVAGMQFILSDVGECYTFTPDTLSVKQSLHSKKDEELLSKTSDKNENGTTFQRKSKSMLDLYWASRKVKRDYVASSDAYPYILVMIGTGVSVLRIDGPRKHERVSGSTIGGGTYWGLCRLLTDVENFPDALALAERGDPSKVDMMVGDIYGSENDALEKLGLASDVVASSFGKLVSKQDPATGLKQEDLARALLLMVTNNIGQVAFLNAQLNNCKRIYFVGNFLRHNVISQKRLAYAINFWSRGKMEALFLEHEGYFGAIGAFLLHQGIIADKYGNVAQRTVADPDLKHEQKHGISKERSLSI
jgi:type II pantothenate kinase